MSTLNEFQMQCEEALVYALGESIAQRQVSGEQELYITGYLPETGFKIYIYADGAEISGQGADERFERPDYQSLDILCREFVHKAAELRKLK